MDVYVVLYNYKNQTDIIGVTKSRRGAESVANNERGFPSEWEPYDDSDERWYSGNYDIVKYKLAD